MDSQDEVEEAKEDLEENRDGGVEYCDSEVHDILLYDIPYSTRDRSVRCNLHKEDCQLLQYSCFQESRCEQEKTSYMKEERFPLI